MKCTMIVFLDPEVKGKPHLWGRKPLVSQTGTGSNQSGSRRLLGETLGCLLGFRYLGMLQRLNSL